MGKEYPEPLSVPDVARDAKVMRKCEDLLLVMRTYIDRAERFEATGDWDAELEMLHIRQYDIPTALKSIEKASNKFYKKHPDGVITEEERIAEAEAKLAKAKAAAAKAEEKLQAAEVKARANK
jgi:regulator of protease activity HflC (stomatin/prohibitin superfamily)